MELRQLEYFVAVAEERHFTRAARRTMVSQSIRALERELGAPLFVRSTRHVELTEVGRAVLVDARRALAGAAAARDAAAAVQGLLRGTVVVGTEQCITGVDVPAVLAAFRAEHPGMDIRLRHEGSLALLEQIPASRVDVAFVAVTGPVPDGVRLIPMASSPMVLMCHPDHPVAGGGATWAELGAQVFVDFPPDWSIRRLGDRAFAQTGLRREVALEVNDVHGLIDLVRHDLGVAIVPESVTRKEKAAGLAVRPLPGGAAIDWEVAVAIGADELAGPAALELCRMARAAAAAPSR